jgi:hypothetical protein
MITGSTAAGEALPPHFQFQTAAKTVEREQLRRECVGFMLGTVGTFGGDEEWTWPATYGLNEKGGMDNDEFEKYMMQMILWMMTTYPHPKVKRYNIYYNICNKCMDLGGIA